MFMFEVTAHLPLPAALQTVDVSDIFGARGWSEFYIRANVKASQIQMFVANIEYLGDFPCLLAKVLYYIIFHDHFSLPEMVSYMVLYIVKSYKVVHPKVRASERILFKH